MLLPVLPCASVTHPHMCFSFLSPLPLLLIFGIASCYVVHSGPKFSVLLLFLLTSQILSYRPSYRYIYP